MSWEGWSRSPGVPGPCPLPSQGSEGLLPCKHPRAWCWVFDPPTPRGHEVQQPLVNPEAWRGLRPAGSRGAASRGPPRPLPSPCPPQPSHRPLLPCPGPAPVADCRALMSVRSGGPASHPPALGFSSETNHQAPFGHLPTAPQPRTSGVVWSERPSLPWAWLLRGSPTPCTPSRSRVAPSKAAPWLWGPPGPGVVPAVPPLSSGTQAGGSLALRPSQCSAHGPQSRRATDCVRNPGAHSKAQPPLPGGVQTRPEGAVFSSEAHGGWRDPQLSHEGDKQEQRRPQGERPREALAARPSETIFKREESLSQDASGTPPPAQMPVLCIVMCLLKKDP